MFSTALRTAAVAASRTAMRPAALRIASRRITTAAPASRVVLKAARAPVLAVSGVRRYSAGGGLGKEEVYSRIAALLKNFDKVNDPEKITPTSHFNNDLGLDSLDTVEVVMAIEEEFSIEIPDKDADQILSIDKAVEYIVSQPDAH